METARRAVGFFRGADFAVPVGAADWRIAAYLPSLGYDPCVFGVGDTVGPQIAPPGVELVVIGRPRVPVLGTARMALCYLRGAARRGLPLIVCNAGVAAAGMLYRRRRRARVVLDIRSIPVEVGRLARWWGTLWLRLALAPGAHDGVTVLSRGMAAELDARMPFLDRLPVAVWGSGYDPQLFRPRLDGPVTRARLGLRDELVLLHHGTLSAGRGLHETLGALRLLLDWGVAAKLVLAGRGPARAEIATRARALGLERSVLLLDPLPYEQIPALVAAADIGLSPLPIDPSWRHQSPIKVYEFLAMGVPVVATDMPCHRDISAAVTLVPNNRPETLAAGIWQAAAGGRAASQQAIEDVRQHTWQARAEVLAAFLDRVVEA